MRKIGLENPEKIRIFAAQILEDLQLVNVGLSDKDLIAAC